MSKITLDLDVNTKEGMNALSDLTRKAQSSAKKMGDSARIASNAWSTFKGVLGANIVSGVFNQMQQAAGMFFGAVVDNTILMETLTTEMTTMTGSAEKAAEVMGKLTDFAATTPFQLEGIATAAKQLIAFGFEADTIADKMKVIGDVAAGSGSQLSDVALVYGQVAAAGKLTGERLLQFQERAVPIGPALAKTMGIAETAVKDMVSKGKVDLATFEKAFATLTEEGGLFFNSMIDKSETTAGVISTLKDNFSLLAADIGKKFLPQFKIVAKELTKFISKNKTSIVSSVGDAFTGSMKRLLKVLPGVVKGLKLAFITTTSLAEISLRGLEGAIDTVGYAMASLARAGLATHIAYLKLKSVFSDNQTELDDATESWREMKNVQEEFAESLAEKGDENKESFEKMWDAFVNKDNEGAMEKRFADIIKDLETVGEKLDLVKDKSNIVIDIESKGDAGSKIFDWEAIKGAFTTMFEETTDAMTGGGDEDGGDRFDWKGIKTSFEETFASVSEWFKETMESDMGKFVKTFATKFLAALKEGSKKQRASMDKLASLDEKIKTAVLHGDEQKADELRQERAEAEKQMIADQGEAAFQTIQAGVSAAGAILGPMGAAAAEVVNTFLEFARDPESWTALIDGIIESLPKIIDALAEAMPTVVEALAASIFPVTAAIMKGMWTVSLQIPAMIGGAISGFVTGLKDELKKITNPLKDISISLDGVSGVLDGLLVDFPQAVIDGAKGFMDALVLNIADFGTELVNSAKNFVNKLVEQIKGAIPNISIGGGGSGSKGPLTGIKGSPIATGGIIPTGYPNDTFPARLTSGEEVVSVSDRKSILNDQAMIKSMLASLIQSNSGGAPMVISTELKINEQVFADMILELDRDNKRMAV